MRIGFIGLGQMGQGMASRLLDAGHLLSVWNRSPERANVLLAGGARWIENPAQLFDNEVVISMLADDAAVQSVWIDSGLVEKTSPTLTHVNMASVSANMGRQLAQLHRATGSSYVAAPVFGRPEAARQGQLDVVAAGPAVTLERCRTLFETLGRRWFNVGNEAHQANIVKIARNFMLATIIESLGEAFALVEKSGVPPEQFLDIITSTSMNAPAYKDYGRRIIAPPADPTFPLRLGLKDVELALEAAADSAVKLPSAALIREHHLAAIAQGYGDKDWAQLGNWIIERA